MNKENKLIPGDKFGKWTVIERGNSKEYVIYYMCKCECGKIKSVRKQSLKVGQSTQCLDCSNTQSKFNKVKVHDSEMINKNFGNYIVKSRSELKYSTSRETRYLCVCTMGHEKHIAKGSLLKGKSFKCKECKE